jgi:transaldolase
MQNQLHRLADLGQSVWLDNISRALISDGRLKKLIRRGLLGLTSNPSIFNQAISASDDYDDAIAPLAAAGKSAFEIYDALSIEDIRDAADLFRPVYRSSRGGDGYVSLEIDPRLSGDTAKTIAEGKRLWAAVDRPNLLLKVPATREGYPAVKELLGEGMNVNVTLIFSLEQYNKTIRAYIQGLRQRLFKRGDLSRLCSVASVFVSRLDTAVDGRLQEERARTGDEARRKVLDSLRGRAAVANSRLIYQRFLEAFGGHEFKKYAAQGASVQRVLWGSTGTKNPKYGDLKYVEELIGKDTVNTMPEKTLAALLDHGKPEACLGANVKEERETIRKLRDCSISVEPVGAKLLEEGLAAFVEAFQSLLAGIETKREKLLKAAPRPEKKAKGKKRRGKKGKR